MTIRSKTEDARDYLLAMIESLAALAIRSGDEELAILLAAVAASARIRDCRR